MDDHAYNTVQIGDQVWFAENLRTTVYANGDPIPTGPTPIEWHTTTDGRVTVYGAGNHDCNQINLDFDACDEVQSLACCGRMYNGYAVLDPWGLCPGGWHVPTVTEWNALEACVSSQGFDGAEGHALRATSGWVDGDGTTATNGTDDFGFSALPGGQLSSVQLNDIVTLYGGAGYSGHYWSSSMGDSALLHIRSWAGHYEHMMHDGRIPACGLSVRCIQD